MLKPELLHGYSEHSLTRYGFRGRWLERRISRSDADIDCAFALSLAWLGADDKVELQRTFLNSWERTVESFEYASLWRRVDRVAGRLLDNGHIAIGKKT